MLGYNRTVTYTNINVLLNIGSGAGEGRKKRGKKSNLPLLMMIVVQMLCWQVLNSGVILFLLLYPCWRTEDALGEDCNQSSFFSCPSGYPFSSMAVLNHMKGLLPYLGALKTLLCCSLFFFCLSLSPCRYQSRNDAWRTTRSLWGFIVWSFQTETCWNSRKGSLTNQIRLVVNRYLGKCSSADSWPTYND